MAKTSVILEDEDIYEIERIVVDEEKADALKFLIQLRKKIKAAQSRTCGCSTIPGGEHCATH